VKRKPAALPLLILILALALSSCMTKSAGELYSLPRRSDQYVQLQQTINTIQESGAEFSAPTSGTNRQSVQLEDLDGDGTKEAIAFFSVPGDEKPLKIIIFRSEDGEYSEAERIESEGATIESVTYTDMNGDGHMEIVVGCQISAGMGILSLYTLRDLQATSLLSTDYTEYSVCDMSTDGLSDLVVMKLSSSDKFGSVVMYSMANDGELVSSTAHLSLGVESVQRMRTGFLSDRTPVIFIEGTVNGPAMVTDIFAWHQEALRNITVNPLSGISDDTVRTYNVYCTDINRDGVIEVPAPVQLPLSAPGAAAYWTIDWYQYGAGGDRRRLFTTFHNYSDGWYLILPDGWRGNLSVHREDTVSGERKLVFSLLSEESGEYRDFLAIYALSGTNKEERLRLPGRFTLARKDSIYAASFVTDPAELGLSLDADYLKENFGIIYSEWNTGETH